MLEIAARIPVPCEVRVARHRLLHQAIIPDSLLAPRCFVPQFPTLTLGFHPSEHAAGVVGLTDLIRRELLQPLATCGLIGLRVLIRDVVVVL